MPRPKILPEPGSTPASRFVGTKQAAAMLGVSVSTIQKLVESGKLRAWRTEGGHRRIAEDDVKAMSRGTVEGLSERDRRTLSLLVVEDNPVAVKGYGRMMARWGEAVELGFARDGVEALLKIAQKRPHLVVTDLVMEPLDGFRLIRTLRESPELTDTRILVVTGLSDAEIAARGGLDDRTLCYHKPLSFERLAGYIDARLQDRAHQR